MEKNERTLTIKKLFQGQKVSTLSQLAKKIIGNERTVQRDLKQLNAISSFTHSGRYISLENIPRYDDHGIWFYKDIGFTKYETSLELIMELINSSKEGLTREEIQEITRIKIFQQIQTLLLRDQLHRVKVGNKYVYIPYNVIKNKKKMLKVVGTHQTEAIYDNGVGVEDLIAVLKVVLQEGNIKMRSLKHWIKKYSLKISLGKMEKLILKYNLDEKKRP